MSTSPMTTVDRLRQAIAETLSIDAQGLQAAIGQLVVATSADYPAAGPEARSLHSSAVRTTVLLADRIPAGQEAQALAQEIALHHGQEAAQAVIGERAAELLGGDGKVQGNVVNPTNRYQVFPMDAGNDQWGVLDTSTQLCWSSDGWRQRDSGWASILTHEESLQKADELGNAQAKLEQGGDSSPSPGM